MIYRSALNKIETIPTKGTWLGLTDNLEKHLEDTSVRVTEGDLVLLFTTGITEGRKWKR